MLWSLARVLANALFPVLWRAQREGLEHLPRAGPLIVAVNHVSWHDPPLAGWAVDPVRTPFFLGKAELFRGRLARWALVALHSIPLDRARGDVGALRRAEELLRAGGCLILFPEGTRSRTGVPGRPKPGIGFLAQRTGAAVVPALVTGTRSAFGPMRIRFGAPMRFPALRQSSGQALRRGSGQALGKQQYRAFAESVMAAIFKLDKGG